MSICVCGKKSDATHLFGFNFGIIGTRAASFYCVPFHGRVMPNALVSLMGMETKKGFISPIYSTIIHEIGFIVETYTAHIVCLISFE